MNIVRNSKVALRGVTQFRWDGRVRPSRLRKHLVRTDMSNTSSHESRWQTQNDALPICVAALLWIMISCRHCPQMFAPVRFPTIRPVLSVCPSLHSVIETLNQKRGQRRDYRSLCTLIKMACVVHKTCFTETYEHILHVRIATRTTVYLKCFWSRRNLSASSRVLKDLNTTPLKPLTISSHSPQVVNIPRWNPRRTA